MIISLISFHLFVFSTTALAVGYGKIEIQVPNKQCKVYVDNKLISLGSKVIKLKQGSHKIKVMEGAVVLLNTNKTIIANKYIAVKAVRPAVVVEIPSISEETAMPTLEEISTAELMAPESMTSILKPTEVTSEVKPAAPPQPAKEIVSDQNKYRINYYLLAGSHIEDSYFKGGGWGSLGAEFGWGNALLYDCAIASSSGDNKKAVISEGSLSVSNLDIGLVYRMGGFYFGTGTGFYMFGHTVDDKILKAFKAVSIKYEETMENNFGFYCKGGWRFDLFGLNMDLGVKGAIVNTTTTATQTNIITKVETEEKLNISLPVTTVYLGILF